MIHHFSMPAQEPHHVATVLAEILRGVILPFNCLEGAYIVAAQDDYGTLIEVLPMGTEIMPGQGDDTAGFCKNAHPYRFSAVHAAISVPISQPAIAAIAHRVGWRVVTCERDRRFRVIEFWVENRLMLELLTPDLVQEYLNVLNAQPLEKTLERNGNRPLPVL